MKRFDAINVIPFIDIMLVMLAIVLMTATFIASGKLDIDVSKASSQNTPPIEPPVELAIDRQLKLYYNQQETTLIEIDKKVSLLAKNTAVVLRVDKSVPFEEFVAVVDILKRNELAKFSIITRQKE